MRLVVDANILVGEALRARGRALIADERLELFVAARAWEEARHEQRRRAALLLQRGRVTDVQATELTATLHRLVATHIAVIPETVYRLSEVVARARIPRDQDDSPTVAVALTLAAGIWTNDGDFLGCGCPTWTTDTLLAEISGWR